MIRFYTIPLIIVFSIGSIWAQRELSLSFLEGLGQSNLANPALINNNQVVVSLPSFYYNFGHTGATVNDLITTNREGEKIFDLGRVLSKFEADNFLQANVNINTFGIFYQWDNWQFSFDHSTHISGFSNYPYELLELAWNGNAAYVDQTVGFGPDLDLTAYSALNFGAAYNFGNFTLGLRAKWLSGLANINTPRHQASVYTHNDFYQLTFETDYQINSASVLKIDGLTDLYFGLNEISFGDFFGGNNGVAFDLGATIQLNDDIRLGASIIDIGNIKWDKKIRNYTSVGTHLYEGFSLSQIIRSDSISFEGTLDTLGRIFSFTESSGSYTTALPVKYYLNGFYQYNDIWQFGVLLYGEQFRGQFSPGLGLSARAVINQLLSVGGVYTIRNDSYFNLGLNIVFQLGPVQLFALTDNVVSALVPYSSRNANGRIGMNLAF